MKIAVVCDVYGKENNGTAVVTYNLIRFLESEGYDVRILCADQASKGKPNHYVVPNLNLGKHLNAYVAKIGVSLAKPDKKIIREALEGVDAVHIMVPLPLGMSTIKIAKKMGLPVTAGFHIQAENITAYFKLNRSKLANKLANRFIYNHLYRHVDAIHYPTKLVRDSFESGIGRSTPGYVISNGVHAYVQKRETEKPVELNDKIVILSTGRYSTEKNQETLIKAISHSKYKDKIQLILAGEGQKEKYYRRLATGLPNEPIFKFYSRTEIIDVLNYADMYVHPAIIELEGISCLEAITCGKLTVVSDSKLSAPKNFAVDEKCVFRAGDEKDLARTIDYWLDHPEERRECEEEYLHSAVGFDQHECMIRMERMILETAAKVGSIAAREEYAYRYADVA